MRRDVEGSARDPIWNALKTFARREWEKGSQVFRTVGRVWNPIFSSRNILTMKLHVSVVAAQQGLYVSD